MILKLLRSRVNVITKPLQSENWREKFNFIVAQIHIFSVFLMSPLTYATNVPRPSPKSIPEASILGSEWCVRSWPWSSFHLPLLLRYLPLFLLVFSVCSSKKFDWIEFWRGVHNQKSVHFEVMFLFNWVPYQRKNSPKESNLFYFDNFTPLFQTFAIGQLKILQILFQNQISSGAKL